MPAGNRRSLVLNCGTRQCHATQSNIQNSDRTVNISAPKQPPGHIDDDL